MSVREAADAIGWDKSRLSRVENGYSTFDFEEALQLIGVYRVTGRKRDHLIQLARTMHESGWWDQGLRFRMESLTTLIEYESEASRITDWAPSLVPGLLQTLEYGRAWMLADGLSPHETETRMIARMRRQQILTSRVNFVAYLGEPALYAPVGGSEVLAGQLDALLDAADRGLVRIVPMNVFHRGQLGPFVVMEFDEWSPVVHIEMIRSSLFMEDEKMTIHYMELVTQLTSVALNETDSKNAIFEARSKIANPTH